MSGPHWQLTSIHRGLDADDYRAARREIVERLEALERLVEGRAIGAGAGLRADAEHVALVERVLADLNALLEVSHTVATYLTGFTAVDAFDDAAQAESSTLRRDRARAGAIEARIVAWLGRFDPEALATASASLREHGHMLRRSERFARHQMGDEAESLAAALDESGGGAWAKLHDDLIARGATEIHVPGRAEPESLGVAALTNLQADADRDVRAAAYAAEVELLERFDVAYAAAMNGIKGQVTTLTARRGWRDAVEMATFVQGISPGALEAMQDAVVASFGTMRRYYHAKAGLLSLPRLAWFDRRAPLPQAGTDDYDWTVGSALVAERFERFSPTLAAYARRAIDEGWIDVPPRAGKRSGAFCAAAPGVRESRILLNWGGTLDDLFTLAHELGHGYHNDCIYRFGRTPLQTRKPMTLAETASMFCETLVIEALAEESGPALRLAALEQSLSGAAAITLDIHARFLFERGVFERRAARELSVAELDALMLDAQEATYGDAIDPEVRFAKAWAEKSHYYSSGLSFYNFPYTFGYLFALGLYARYQADPDDFVPRYDVLLASTGMDEVATLAQGMGIDIEDGAFWQSGLDIVAARVDEYQALAKETT